MNTSLVPFDETNKNHLDALNYFASYDGHPHYVVDGDVGDFDFGFREFLAETFDLPEAFLEEPNGCFHELLARNGDLGKFKICYEFIDEDSGEAMAALFEFDGKLLIWGQNDRTVVMEPVKDSVKLLGVEGA